MKENGTTPLDWQGGASTKAPVRAQRRCFVPRGDSPKELFTIAAPAR
jgi:hypothetical protein